MNSRQFECDAHNKYSVPVILVASSTIVSLFPH